jgi:hypothetical protein
MECSLLKRIGCVMGWTTKIRPAEPGNATATVVEAHGRG